MRSAELGVTCFVSMNLLCGCAGSGGVGSAKPNAPVVEVGNADAAGKAKDKPKIVSVMSDKDVEMVGILGVLKAGDSAGPLDSPWGDAVVGGVVGGVPSSGFGGLGLSGVGTGGGGIGGLGGLGTIGRIGSSDRTSRYSGPASDQVRVKLGQVVVTGPLTVDVVQRFVDDHVDDVQLCHRLEQENAGLRYGSMTLMFTVDPTGHVSDVRLAESTIYSRDLESCVAHVAGSFEFPAPKSDKVQVLLPITF